MYGKILNALCSSALVIAATFLSASSTYAQIAMNPQQACAAYSQLASRSGVGAGALGGGSPLPAGALITVSTTLGTATSATFVILNAVSGLTVVAGPAAIPGTLTHVVTAAESTNGIGWGIETANGTVNVTASCSMPAVTAPALSPFGLFACGLLLLVLGAAAVRYKAQSLR